MPFRVLLNARPHQIPKIPYYRLLSQIPYRSLLNVLVILTCGNTMTNSLEWITKRDEDLALISNKQ